MRLIYNSFRRVMYCVLFYDKWLSKIIQNCICAIITLKFLRLRRYMWRLGNEDNLLSDTTLRASNTYQKTMLVMDMVREGVNKKTQTV